MRHNLNFILAVNKLKEVPRTGWVLMKVKNPETIAEHTFRLVILTWLLAVRKKLNLKRAMKIALFHDLCEVYAGDVTPFFYYTRLPRDKREREKTLMKWIRLSRKEKEKRGRMKFRREKRALLKLIKFLEQDKKRELFSTWFDYEARISREGKFVKQIDRIETLIQAIEYFGKKESVGGSSWWEGTEEIIEDPLLLKFLKVIQKKFYGQVVGDYERDEELENILEFIVNIGKLKKLERKYWLAHGIKKPETVAGHIFTVVLLAWLLGQEKKNLNMEKIIKMALCHELSAIYTGDTIPYIVRLPKDKMKRREVLKRWPRLPKEEKEKRFLKDYKEEKKSIEKLTSDLEPKIKKEIIQSWDEYRRVANPEALFLTQINTISVLLQGLQYQKTQKNYFTDPLWEWAFEKTVDPAILKFMEEIKRKFYSKDSYHV